MKKVADKPTVTCLDKEFDVFLTSTQIQDRIKTLAERIAKDYEGQKPILLGILNGCFRFVGDIFNYLDIECEVSFVKLKSYVGTQSGEMKMMMGLDTSLEGRPVIVLEDIVDTGKTMHTFLPELKSQKLRNMKFL
jgi:hypoxanthine phosphoribosyltransferase